MALKRICDGIGESEGVGDSVGAIGGEVAHFAREIANGGYIGGGTDAACREGGAIAGILSGVEQSLEEVWAAISVRSAGTGTGMIGRFQVV